MAIVVIDSYDDLINNIGQGFIRKEPIYNWQGTTVAANPFGNPLNAHNGYNGGGLSKTIPTLESGVNYYLPKSWWVRNNGWNISAMICKAVNLGSLDFSGGAPGSFTDGSTMGTATVWGTAGVAQVGQVMLECTTAFNATPGTFTFTYTDQDGNTGNTSSTLTPAASTPVGSAQLAQLGSAMADWGVRDITAAASSGGTTPSGVVKFWGIVPIGMVAQGATAASIGFEELIASQFNYVPLVAGDEIRYFSTQVGTPVVYGEISYVGSA